MTLRSLLAIATLCLPLFLAPAAGAQDAPWGDFSPAANPNLVRHIYYYPQTTASSGAAAGVQFGSPGMADMPVTGNGQKRRSTPQYDLPPARYASMANKVNIGAEGNDNATYFKLHGPWDELERNDGPTDGNFAGEPAILNGEFEGGNVAS